MPMARFAATVTDEIARCNYFLLLALGRFKESFIGTDLF